MHIRVQEMLTRVDATLGVRAQEKSMLESSTQEKTGKSRVVSVK